MICPALRLPQPVHLLCREGTLERLMAELAQHELDVVLSDAPVTPSLNIRAYNHPLAEYEVAWMATPALARSHRRHLPRSLDAAPVLLPTDDTAIRRGRDQWFAAEGMRPLGLAGGVTGRCYAISVQRKLRHPAVAAIIEAGRRPLQD